MSSKRAPRTAAQKDYTKIVFSVATEEAKKIYKTGSVKTYPEAVKKAWKTPAVKTAQAVYEKKHPSTECK